MTGRPGGARNQAPTGRRSPGRGLLVPGGDEVPCGVREAVERRGRDPQRGAVARERPPRRDSARPLLLVGALPGRPNDPAPPMPRGDIPGARWAFIHLIGWIGMASSIRWKATLLACSPYSAIAVSHRFSSFPTAFIRLTASGPLTCLLRRAWISRRRLTEMWKVPASGRHAEEGQEGPPAEDPGGVVQRLRGRRKRLCRPPGRARPGRDAYSGTDVSMARRVCWARRVMTASL